MANKKGLSYLFVWGQRFTYQSPRYSKRVGVIVKRHQSTRMFIMSHGALVITILWGTFSPIYLLSTGKRLEKLLGVSIYSSVYYGIWSKNCHDFLGAPFHLSIISIWQS